MKYSQNMKNKQTNKTNTSVCPYKIQDIERLKAKGHTDMSCKQQLKNDGVDMLISKLRLSKKV